MCGQRFSDVFWPAPRGPHVHEDAWGKLHPAFSTVILGTASYEIFRQAGLSPDAVAGQRLLSSGISIGDYSDDAPQGALGLEYDRALWFIRSRFVNVHMEVVREQKSSENRRVSKLASYMTNSTDPGNAKRVFRKYYRTIIIDSLKDSGLVYHHCRGAFELNVALG